MLSCKGGLDGLCTILRYCLVLRVLRVIRLSVITLNLSDIGHLSSTDVVDGAIRVKIAQLLATIVGVVFTSASAIHLFENMPWHVALYFVVTTLTTVGFGDIAIETVMGRSIVMVMMVSAVMVIPVKVTQMYREATAQRRKIKGWVLQTTLPFSIAGQCIFCSMTRSPCTHLEAVQTRGNG